MGQWGGTRGNIHSKTSVNLGPIFKGISNDFIQFVSVLKDSSRMLTKVVFFHWKKPFYQIFDIIDSVQIQHPTCFLGHLEYIPIDFRGPGAFRTDSAWIYRRKTWIFDAKTVNVRFSTPEVSFVGKSMVFEAHWELSGQPVSDSSEMSWKHHFWAWARIPDHPGFSRSRNWRRQKIDLRR